MRTIRLVNLVATQDNKSVNNLGDTMKGAASAGLLVQSYCNQVLQQPNIIIPTSVVDQLPPINQHLDDARSHADYYLITLQPNIIKVVTDVGGYSQQFTSFYLLINDRLNDWKGGDQSGKDDAKALLEQLRNAIAEKTQKVDAVVTNIGKFILDINADVSNFNTASSRADVVIGGDQGQLKSLDDTINQLDKNIGGVSAGIAVSGLGIIGGAFMIAVGAVANFVTAGTSTPVVVAGVVLLVAGIAGLTGSSIALAQLLQTKSDRLREKAALDANLKFLKSFKSTMGQLSDSASIASTQLLNMRDSWKFLQCNMENVIGSLDNAQTHDDLPILVRANLNTANSQWGNVQDSVRTVEKQMSGVQTSILRDSNGNLLPLNLVKELQDLTPKKAA